MPLESCAGPFLGFVQIFKEIFTSADMQRERESGELLFIESGGEKLGIVNF